MPKLTPLAKVEGKVGRGVGAGAGSFLEGHVSDMKGALEVLSAFEQAFDSEELEAGVFAAVGGGVEAGFGGFFLHGLSGFLEGNIDTDFGFLALEDTDEVSNF